MTYNDYFHNFRCGFKIVELSGGNGTLPKWRLPRRKPDHPDPVRTGPAVVHLKTRTPMKTPTSTPATKTSCRPEGLPPAPTTKPGKVTTELHEHSHKSTLHLYIHYIELQQCTFHCIMDIGCQVLQCCEHSESLKLFWKTNMILVS